MIGIIERIKIDLPRVRNDDVGNRGGVLMFSSVVAAVIGVRRLAVFVESLPSTFG
jgi:hypothetical protein